MQKAGEGMVKQFKSRFAVARSRLFSRYACEMQRAPVGNPQSAETKSVAQAFPGSKNSFFIQVSMNFAGGVSLQRSVSRAPKIIYGNNEGNTLVAIVSKQERRAEEISFENNGIKRKNNRNRSVKMRRFTDFIFTS